MKKNKKALEQFFLSQNINAEIIQVPLPSEIIIENKRLVASYINFYFQKNLFLFLNLMLKKTKRYMIFLNHYLEIKILK